GQTKLGRCVVEHASAVDPDRDPLLQELHETGELGTAAGDEDPADLRAGDLRRVELERRADLVDEAAGPLHHDAPDVVRVRAALDDLAALQALRHVVVDPEPPGHRERDVAPPGGQDAHEPGDAAVVDADVGDVGPNV